MAHDDLKLVIWIQRQQADLFRGPELIRSYAISSAKNGTGYERGSLKTPLGLHRVARKIGEQAPLGTVFRERRPTGEVWSLDQGNALRDSSEDLILTRILWLDGCEAENKSTFDRCIYLHGTNQEELLGQPASHGCIRFSNADIEDLFDLIPEGALVEILA